MAQVRQSLGERVALEIRYPQAPFSSTLTAELPRNQRLSNFPKEFGKGSFQHYPMIPRKGQYRQPVKDQGKMYTAHTSALTFKDHRLRNQAPTWASILARTSDQFRSRWRSAPNHTPRMRTGPSLQRKRPSSKHPTANLRSRQSWPWHLPPSRTSRPPSSLPICPDGWTRKQWYQQRTRKS